MSALARASRGIQAAHASAGLPTAPAWAGYWNFTTGLIIVMFILYLAKNNRLSTWVAFLGWGTPKQIASASNAATPSASSGTPQTLGGLLSGAPGQGGPFAGGSTDPVAGSVTQALKALPSLSGAALGLGN